MKRTDRRAHAAQAGVAALVTASLLAFSLIAFRTGLSADSRPGVRAQRPAAGAARPVVLPASPPPPAAPAAEPVVVATTEIAPDDVVLGTRFARPSTADVAPANRKPPEATDGAHRSPGREPSARKPSKTKAPKTKSKDRKDKQTGHEKARGKGHHKHSHNGAHDVSASGSKVGSSRPSPKSATPAKAKGHGASASHRKGARPAKPSKSGGKNKRGR